MMEVKMKRTALQICSLLGLVVTLAVVSVSAQIVGRYKTQIPFDFKVGGKTYQAGDYVVSVRNADSRTTTKILLIKDANGRSLWEKFSLQNGRRSKDQKTTLVFYRSENQNVLAEMISPDFGLAINKSKRESRRAGKPNPKPEIVAITLVRQNKNVE